MKIEGHILNPNEIEYSLTITMTIEQWERFLESIENKSDYPAWKIVPAINDAIREAKRKITTEIVRE